MKNFYGNDETPTALEQSFKSTTKLKRELLSEIEKKTVTLIKLSFLVENIHLKTGEALQNFDFGIQ